jgi:hypothetical protein
MILDHVESPFRRRQFCYPIDSNHSPAPRLEWERVKKTARTAVVHLHALAGLAGAKMLGHVEVLTHPEGKVGHQ